MLSEKSSSWKKKYLLEIIINTRRAETTVYLSTYHADVKTAGRGRRLERLAIDLTSERTRPAFHAAKYTAIIIDDDDGDPL